MTKEKLRLHAEQEIERLKITSQEKIELERINLGKMMFNIGVAKDTASKGKRKVEEMRSPDEVSSDKSVPSIKLPQLELLKFDDNILKWQEF